MNKKIAQICTKVRNKGPLVLNITNYVAMNNSANALLAVGGSPIMSKTVAEMDDLANVCDSLVINIGTLEPDSIEAMLAAQKAFNGLNKPVILDPVGAGASKLRNETIKKLLKSGTVQLIRGNGSEIIAVAGFNSNTKGVDSQDDSIDAIVAGQKLAVQYNCIVCISGVKDVVIDKTRVCFIDNGNVMMTKVTALGCSASAVLGAYAAVIDEGLYECAIAGCAVMSLCGEIAARDSNGPGSLQVNLIDTLYNIDDKTIEKLLKIEIR